MGENVTKYIDNMNNIVWLLICVIVIFLIGASLYKKETLAMLSDKSNSIFGVIPLRDTKYL